MLGCEIHLPVLASVPGELLGWHHLLMLQGVLPIQEPPFVDLFPICHFFSFGFFLFCFACMPWDVYILCILASLPTLSSPYRSSFPNL